MFAYLKIFRPKMKIILYICIDNNGPDGDKDQNYDVNE